MFRDLLTKLTASQQLTRVGATEKQCSPRWASRCVKTAVSSASSHRKRSDNSLMHLNNACMS